MNPAIVVPVFYSAREATRNASTVNAYDHPTPIHQEGELPRLLESLTTVDGVGQIIILVSAERSIEMQAADKAQSIAMRFPMLDIVVIGAPEASLVHQRMEQLNLGKPVKEVGLSGYGAIRNMGLVVAHAMGFDSVVFLDDDEVIDDPEFLTKAMYGLGKLTRKGIPILAKTGFYLNSAGSCLASKENKWYDRFWRQNAAFNEWISKALRGPRLSRSNHVCGGCLALHREAYKRLSFDPWITRGEDLDYMLNLRMYGSDIWFDNRWHMRHLPPATKSEGLRFRQDIFRWLYEYRKMEYSRTQIDLMKITPESLEPYPGSFLRPGIMNRIRITAWLRSFGCSDKAGYRKAAKAAAGEAATYAERHCQNYFEFQYVWPELMNRLEGDRALRIALIQSTLQRRGVDVDPREQQAFVELQRQECTVAPSGDVRTGAVASVVGATMAAVDAYGHAASSEDARFADAPAAVSSSDYDQGVAGVYAQGRNIDPGATTEIRLNLADWE